MDCRDNSDQGSKIVAYWFNYTSALDIILEVRYRHHKLLCLILQQPVMGPANMISRCLDSRNQAYKDPAESPSSPLT